MTNEDQQVRAVSLLEEIDARQNELLDELDRLNHQIERVIAEWVPSKPPIESPVQRPGKAAA